MASDEFSYFMDVVNKLFQAYLSDAYECSQSSGQPEADVVLVNTSDAYVDIEEFLYKDEDATNAIEECELDIYLKEKLVQWVDPSGKGAEFNILTRWKTKQVKYPVISSYSWSFSYSCFIVALEYAFNSIGVLLVNFVAV